MDDHLHWPDVEEIAEELEDAHPDVDPLTVRFTDLRRMVEALPDFEEQEGHPCNERILEAIQANWIRERQGDAGGDGDEDDDDEAERGGDRVNWR